jgi:hypothetical protein
MHLREYKKAVDLERLVVTPNVLSSQRKSESRQTQRVSCFSTTAVIF